MNTGFQIIALPYEAFAPLFARSNEQLQALGARRMVVGQKPGYPCRVSLMDAGIGETVLLLQFNHHDVDSPYHGSGPIFVRKNAQMATPAVNEIPAMFNHRLLSVRGYDGAGMMLQAEVVQGSDLVDAIGRVFDNSLVSYLHIHNAAPGCFNCKVVRA